MAKRTKAKVKRGKTTEAARRRKAVRKTKTIRRRAAKKAPPRRATRTEAKPTAKVVVKPKRFSQAEPKAVKPPLSSPAQAPAGEERIGAVAHYYSHLSVAAVRLEPGTKLRVGDVIRIRGHTTDFTQKVESLEVNHTPVTEVGPNDDFGLKVVEHAREHDVVYKV
jgi:hypothetical protein